MEIRITMSSSTTSGPSRQDRKVLMCCWAILPAGTKAYRPESGTKTVETEVPFGDYKEFPVLDEAGNRIPVTVQAGEEGKYPKYEADGSMMTRDKVVNYTVRDAKLVTGDGLDHDRSEAALQEASGSLDEAQVQEMLEKNFTTSNKNLLFVKAKLEAALRANQKRVPISNGTYSTPDNGIFDQGKQGSSRNLWKPSTESFHCKDRGWAESDIRGCFMGVTGLL